MIATQKLRRTVLAASLATCAALSVTIQSADAAADLVQNGVFKTDPMLASGWVGNGKVDPWQRVGAGYDLLSASFAQHPNGYQAVDLGPEFTGGGIQQELGPVPSGWYKLSFQDSPDAWGPCINQDVRFTVEIDDEDGTALWSAKVEPHAADGKAHWEKAQYNLDVRPQGGSLFLKFLGNDAVSCQAAITNVHMRPML